jgi:hypothetical protein
MGDDLASVILLCGAVLASLWLLNQLAALAWGENSLAAAWRATVTMVAVVILMCAILQRTQVRELAIVWGGPGEVSAVADRRGATDARSVESALNRQRPNEMPQ